MSERKPEETLGDSLSLSEHLHATKLRQAGTTGRNPVEVDVRDEVDRDTGRMTRREQMYDRENDFTQETVTYLDTGEIKFTKSGKLSEKNSRHVPNSQ